MSRLVVAVVVVLVVIIGGLILLGSHAHEQPMTHVEKVVPIANLS